MPSITVRLARLEENALTGHEAALREAPIEALEAIARSWSAATWGRMLAEADPDDVDFIVAGLRRFGPGAPKHG